MVEVRRKADTEPGLQVRRSYDEGLSADGGEPFAFPWARGGRNGTVFALG